MIFEEAKAMVAQPYPTRIWTLLEFCLLVSANQTFFVRRTPVSLHPVLAEQRWGLKPLAAWRSERALREHARLSDAVLGKNLARWYLAYSAAHTAEITRRVLVHACRQDNSRITKCACIYLCVWA